MKIAQCQGKRYDVNLVTEQILNPKTQRHINLMAEESESIFALSRSHKDKNLEGNLRIGSKNSILASNFKIFFV